MGGLDGFRPKHEDLPILGRRPKAAFQGGNDEALELREAPGHPELQGNGIFCALIGRSDYFQEAGRAGKTGSMMR